MTQKLFHPTTKTGPKPVSGEITLEGPEEIGEEIEQRGFQRYMLPAMGGIILLMIVITIYTGARQFSMYQLMFPLMFIMMGISVMAARAGTGSKSVPEFDADRKTYLRYLTKVRNRVAGSAAQQIAFWGYHAPHPEDLTGLIGKARQWSRHPGAAPSGPDDITADGARRKADIRADLYLVARVATGAVEAEDKLLRPDPTSGDLVGPDSAPAPYLEPVSHMWMVKFVRTHGLIHDCPKVTRLRSYPTVAIGGDPRRAASLLRAMICGLALFHSPEALQIRLRTNTPDDPEWSWLKWLPHLHHPNATGAHGPRRLIYAGGNNNDCVEDLMGTGPHQPDILSSTGPYRLIINLDPNTTNYPAEGRIGVTYLTLGASPAHYQLKVGADGALFHSSRAAAAGLRGWQPLGTADTLSAHDAATFARRLAGWSATTTQLLDHKPAAARRDTSWQHLIGVSSMAELTPRRWTEYPDQSRERLRFAVGHTYTTTEPLSLDIKEGGEYGMGPHGVVIGTTGSGKSQFLRTLLLSAMAAHHPNQLNMILADFKGGTSFFGMKNMPHVQAIITDMADEADLVDRFLVVLAGIINQRKKILVDAHTQLDGQAVSGLADYEQKRQAGADLVPVPALFVVVDEFAEMMEQHPEFLNAFKQIVQVGRGLRIHLLLASQTIANIASQWEKLKGNITYRIALRTTDTAESKSIIGTPEAHYIKGFEAGVGYLCTGPTEDPIKFRTAYTGGPYQPTSTHPDDTPTSTPPPKSHMPPVRPIYRHRRRNWYRPMNTTPSDTATLADVVLQALSTGYDGPPTARPWLPPLRQPTALGNLLAHHQLSHLSIPVGIVDLPYWLTQKPWTITLDATTFSAAIGGVGKTGKSTFIQTLLLSAAYTHSPHDLAIFGLDFSSGKLVQLEALPHVVCV